MTLEEAKKKIEELGEDAWNKWKKEGNLISQGYALGMDDALGTLDKVESSGNPEQLTFKELARELRKLFGFGYLVAYGSELYGYRVRAYLFKPKYIPIGGFWFNDTRGNDALLDISFSDLICDLDLSEYKDTDGNIDYSRCIVEVTDASE